MDPALAYQELLAHSRETSLLGSCVAVLGWDEQTYMPRRGAELRGEQLALLAALTHDQATDPRLDALLLAAADGADPESAEAANVRELRRRYDRATRLPRSLVSDLARAVSRTQNAWVEARQAREFARLAPDLEALLDLKRQEAACLAGMGDPYDALLDEYEPGAKGAELARLFEGLRGQLVALLDRVRDRDPGAPPPGPFPVDRQAALGTMVATAVGFDFERGRLDTTEHPFCSGIGPGDCRLTTRYCAEDLFDSFFSTLHEVGHGLYEQGLDPARFGSPLGEAASLGVHESQSRLWENAVGRSRPFWSYWLPLARGLFPQAFGSARLDGFLAAVQRVRPSLIRVDADELTYNLHILIRFDLERALIAGALGVSELPGAWNEAYQRVLGIIPTHDAEGCLQDIHWSAGLFGYFPTYTIGNLYAAQLMNAAREHLGDLDAAFASGEFQPLLAWLRQNIHQHGQRYRPEALITRVTGRPPDPAPLVDALRSRYVEGH